MGVVDGNDRCNFNSQVESSNVTHFVLVSEWSFFLNSFTVYSWYEKKSCLALQIVMELLCLLLWCVLLPWMWHEYEHYKDNKG